ncbi:hypothetical protein [Solimicrobium silvestre]|uniref:Uncharacterized protein n=1 Tax=Solimicrobium silvestre TaxID=2099400 RepID=A0A2S9GXL8_9BURK|nr:hypothetical protein [Solimicrobium silvestre]PRC92459.1 hypothetical protein S2091_2834 [Solimicrobium silvestre]
MESSKLFRYELIKNYVALYAKKDVDGLIVLWEMMAVEIVALVGEGGFKLLYERCISLTQVTFPWLVVGPPLPQNGRRFVELRLRFEEQSIAQTNAANNQLLITFTDLLASLIGEQITVVILHTAMGNSKTENNSTKELENE